MSRRPRPRTDLQEGRPEPPFDRKAGSLALRELEAAAGFLLAVLLALDDAGVAGREAFLLERAAKLRLIVGQRLGEAVTDRAGLARPPPMTDTVMSYWPSRFAICSGCCRIMRSTGRAK